MIWIWFFCLTGVVLLFLLRLFCYGPRLVCLFLSCCFWWRPESDGYQWKAPSNLHSALEHIFSGLMDWWHHRMWPTRSDDCRRLHFLRCQSTTFWKPMTSFVMVGAPIQVSHFPSSIQFNSIQFNSIQFSRHWKSFFLIESFSGRWIASRLHRHFRLI